MLHPPGLVGLDGCVSHKIFAKQSKRIENRIKLIAFDLILKRPKNEIELKSKFIFELIVRFCFSNVLPSVQTSRDSNQD